MHARRTCAKRSPSLKSAVMLISMGAVENGLTIGINAPIVLSTYATISAVMLTDQLAGAAMSATFRIDTFTVIPT